MVWDKAVNLNFSFEKLFRILNGILFLLKIAIMGELLAENF
jgi:hypothetical protein